MDYGNSTMDIHDIRYENLTLLVKEFGTQTRLAELAGTDQSYLSQIITRRPMPSGKTRQVGHELARALERAAGKPAGWMDRPHGLAEDAAKYTASKIRLAPIQIALKTVAGADGLISESRIEWPDYIEIADADPTAYAAILHGDHLRPRVRDGEIIILSSRAQCAPGDDVLIRTISGAVMVKHLLYIRDQKWTLGSINDLSNIITMSGNQIAQHAQIISVLSHVGKSLYTPRK
jgi:hypothetical protein